MSNRTLQDQQEQASLLQSQDRSPFVVSDVKPVSSKMDNQSSTHTQKDQEDRSFSESNAIRTAESVAKNKKVHQALRNKMIDSQGKILSQDIIGPTSSQPVSKNQQNVFSDDQKEYRQMREKCELIFQEWKRQKQIDSTNRIKKMLQQAQLQRQQQKQERRKRNAMNKWSDQVGFFQNIKRFLGIAQRNDKTNK